MFLGCGWRQAFAGFRVEHLALLTSHTRASACSAVSNRPAGLPFTRTSYAKTASLLLSE